MPVVTLPVDLQEEMDSFIASESSHEDARTADIRAAFGDSMVLIVEKSPKKDK